MGLGKATGRGIQGPGRRLVGVSNFTAICGRSARGELQHRSGLRLYFLGAVGGPQQHAVCSPLPLRAWGSYRQFQFPVVPRHVLVRARHPLGHWRCARRLGLRAVRGCLCVCRRHETAGAREVLRARCCIATDDPFANAGSVAPTHPQPRSERRRINMHSPRPTSTRSGSSWVR